MVSISWIAVPFRAGILPLKGFDMTFTIRSGVVATAAMLMLLLPATSRAQGFVSGSAGINSGGGTLGNEPATFGFGVGALGGLVGAEFDVTFTPDFFTESAVVGDNRVTTAMGNVLIGPKIGAVRPYAVGGLGLMRFSADGPFGVGNFDRNDVAMNVGGGLMAFITPAVGIRGDVRYFRNLNDNEEEFGIDFDQFDYWRSTVGVVFRF